MLKMKMKTFDMDINIDLVPAEGCTVNTHALLSTIEKFVQYLDLFEFVNVTVTKSDGSGDSALESDYTGE